MKNLLKKNLSNWNMNQLNDKPTETENGKSNKNALNCFFVFLLCWFITFCDETFAVADEFFGWFKNVFFQCVHFFYYFCCLMKLFELKSFRFRVSVSSLRFQFSLWERVSLVRNYHWIGFALKRRFEHR